MLFRLKSVLYNKPRTILAQTKT